MSSRSSMAERIPVLMYHRVGAARNAWEARYCVSPERFEHQMNALHGRGMQACSTDELVAWLLDGRPLADGSFVLTFDDGFMGVYEHALPALSALAWRATVFLVSGLIGKRDHWTAQANPAGVSYPLLGKREIAEMAKHGFSFQSHTRSHPDLRSLSALELAEELGGARCDLEDLLGGPVRYLAYPFGWHDQRVVDAAQASGYSAAFCTQPGFNRRSIDRYRIRRLEVYGTDSPAALLRKVALGTNDGSLWHSVRYYGARVAARLR